MERIQTECDVREERMRLWVQRYSDAILRTCFLYLCDRTMAEDALQDTLIKAWRHMAAYEKRDIANERAWLMRIAINTCKDYRKTAWWRHIDSRRALEELPCGMMQTQDASRELTHMVMELPVRYKQVILLYYFQGLNQHETAHALGISPSAVVRRLRSAEKLLKERMTGGEERAE